MKRMIRYVLIIGLILMSMPCFATNISHETYSINGEQVTCEVIIKDNVTYVSCDTLYDLLGLCTVASLTGKGQLWIGKDEVELNHETPDIAYQIDQNRRVCFVGSIFEDSINVELAKNLPFYKDRYYVPLKAIAKAYHMDVTYVKSAKQQGVQPIQVTQNNMDTYFNTTYGQLVQKYGNTYETVGLDGAKGIIFKGTDTIFCFGTYEEPQKSDKVSSIHLSKGKSSSILGLNIGMNSQEVVKILGQPEYKGDSDVDGSEMAIYEVGGHRLFLTFENNYSYLSFIFLKEENN